MSGLCPQHNVLYDNLTVEEHLWFFANLKGVANPDLVKMEVDRFIVATGLEDKRCVHTKKLSGGMKRKLSVGIALIGDSKVWNYCCSFDVLYLCFSLLFICHKMKIRMLHQNL